MNRLAAALLMTVLAAPAWAGQCAPATDTPIPSVIGKAYPKARAALVAGGWMPFLDREMIDSVDKGTTPTIRRSGLSTRG